MTYCYRCGFIGDNINIVIVAPKTIEHLCPECAKTLERIKNGNLSDSNRVSTPVAKSPSGSKTPR
jgi:predicted RNA-binding Zn-ribbon protein involved in translation (DUF1610 family)